MTLYTTKLNLWEIVERNNEEFIDFILECIGHPLLCDITITAIGASDNVITLTIDGTHEDFCSEDCMKEKHK